MLSISAQVKIRKTASNFFIVLVFVFINTDARSADCATECSSGTPHCLLIPKLVAGPDIPWAMRGLYRYVLKQGQNFTIKSSDMLGFFRMKETEDPCQRGSTDFNAGLVQNLGASVCRISLDVTAIRGLSDLKIGFDVPPKLQSSFEVRDNKYTFRFENSTDVNTPAFWIDNPNLNSDWGGLLSQFTFSENEVVVTTKNGCISYKY